MKTPDFRCLCCMAIAVILLATFSLPNVAHAQGTLTGSIKGNVRDIDTKQPLAGANILVLNSQLGASADLDGNFSIGNAPVGDYTLVVSFLGYEPKTLTNVLVKSQRISHLNVEMKMSAIETDVVLVRPNRFSGVGSDKINKVGMSNEEIRRSAGSAGDVCRIITGLPSVAKINDTRNSLVVRGGSPMENGFFLDNIEIPNINHFPLQGASAGAMSLLNVDFISSVKFFSGGFGAQYGDKLSSITELAYRNGNPDEFDGQLDLSYQGFGAVLEGPLGNNGDSWLLSARRSYVDYLIETMDVEASTTPSWSDVQGKLTLNIDSKNQITILDVAGYDESTIEKQLSIDNEENNYGNTENIVNTLGANWRYIWGGKGYSNTSISHTITQWNSEWFETKSDNLLTSNESTEQEINLRNVNHYLISRKSALDFGVSLKLLNNDLNQVYGAYTDPTGLPTEEIEVVKNYNSHKIGAFVSYQFPVFQRLSITSGLRWDYFELNSNNEVSPRIQGNFELDDLTDMSFSAGIFRQFLPPVLLDQNKQFTNLKDPMSAHYILALSRMITSDTRLTVEGYAKEYQHYPLDPDQPSVFVIDQSNSQDGFTAHAKLVDTGKAFSRGVEVMIQKKLAENLYGLVSGSYSRSRYRDYSGVWHDRIYDNRFMCSVEGGYKASQRWEFTGRWVYAGGRPYTPFDLNRSTEINRAVLDSTRINEARLSDYHSLDLRADYRVNFRATNLVLYFSIWNAYNRQNIAGYYWNEQKNTPDTFYQWGTMPVIGVEFEF